MNKTYLPDLIPGLEKELLRLGHTKGSMVFYRRRWNQLMAYAEGRGEYYYTEQLGMGFLKEFFGITQEDSSRTLPQAETQGIRVIRMVGDFQPHHAVLRRYPKHKEILTNPIFVGIRSRFRIFCEKKSYSKITTEHYVKQSPYLMDYLAAQGMDGFTTVTLDTANAYVRTLAGFTYKTVGQHICSLRAFFRFLYQEGIVPDGLAARMPMVKARKQTAIPPVWAHGELKQLTGAIGRGSPKGKRDYAIILTACRPGLRCTDIKNLCFENFSWAEKKPCFTQPETGQPMGLPLVPDVGWAVIDYLKYGRPKVDSSRILVRHMAPFPPFSEGGHLNQLVKAYMVKAHIPMRGRHRGMPPGLWGGGPLWLAPLLQALSKKK